MKRLFVLIISILMFSVSLSADKVDKDTMQWRYEVQDLGIQQSQQGKYVFKIWTYSKNPKKALMQAGKNAVHAVIFKGFGVHPSLISDATAYHKNKAFFDEFFKDGGQYQMYIHFINNGAIAPADNIKLPNEYKIGVKCVVQKDALRKALEEAGIIEKANSIF